MLLLAGWASSACLKVLQRGLAATPGGAAPAAENIQAWSVCLGHDSCESLHSCGSIFSLVLWTREWRFYEVFTPRLNIFRLLMWLRIQFKHELPVPACLLAHSPFYFPVLLNGEKRHVGPSLSAGPRYRDSVVLGARMNHTDTQLRC